MMWRELGKEHYLWMGDVIVKHDITFEELYKFFSGSLYRITDKFKDGTLKFTDSQKQKIISTDENFTDIVNFSEVFKGEGFGKIFRLACADIVKHSDYVHDRMIKKLHRDAGRLLGCVNRIDFVHQPEHVYNHGEREQIDFIRSKTKKSTAGKLKASKGMK